MRDRLAMLLALSAVLYATAACSRGAAPATEREAVPVTAAAAERRDVPITIDAIGAVEPYSTVAIRAQVGGELIEVAFREGQDVRQNDLLFRIDPRPYQAALRSAAAQLEKDTVQMETARKDVARYADLVAKDYVTQEEFERIRTNSAALDAAVTADRAAVDNATVQLEYCTIRSPIGGRTGKLMVNRGNLVKANADTPMLTINQVDPIYVAFSVPQQNLTDIKERRRAGTRMEVTATVEGLATQPPRGILSFIDNAVDGTTGMVLLKATFPNRDRSLWPGQFVHVSLLVSIQPGALVVPTEAIQSGQQGPYVYVIKPDLTAELRPIVPGTAHEHVTVVEKGLEPDERVVRDGQVRLVPGAAVKIIERPAASTTAGSAKDGTAAPSATPGDAADR